jgi:hypothetical protein
MSMGIKKMIKNYYDNTLFVRTNPCNKRFKKLKNPGFLPADLLEGIPAGRSGIK